jgi:hypothetical protein
MMTRVRPLEPQTPHLVSRQDSDRLVLAFFAVVVVQ